MVLIVEPIQGQGIFDVCRGKQKVDPVLSESNDEEFYPDVKFDRSNFQTIYEDEATKNDFNTLDNVRRDKSNIERISNRNFRNIQEEREYQLEEWERKNTTGGTMYYVNGNPIKINKKYIGGLKGKEKQAQIESILAGKDRPKTSYKSKRSSWCEKFEKKHETNIDDKQYIHDNLLKKKGQKQIINKGKAAYYTSGSRPNQTPYSWGKARLCSVLMDGPSKRIDKDIVKKYQVFNYKLKYVEEINDKKRFEATFSDGRKTKFGQIGGSTFIDHKDGLKKMNYIKRHLKDLNTLDPQRAGYLSMFILWNEKTLIGSIKDFNKRLQNNDWSL